MLLIIVYLQMIISLKGMYVQSPPLWKHPHTSINCNDTILFKCFDYISIKRTHTHTHKVNTKIHTYLCCCRIWTNDVLIIDVDVVRATANCK